MTNPPTKKLSSLNKTDMHGSRFLAAHMKKNRKTATQNISTDRKIDTNVCSGLVCSFYFMKISCWAKSAWKMSKSFALAPCISYIFIKTIAAIGIMAQARKMFSPFLLCFSFNAACMKNKAIGKRTDIMNKNWIIGCFLSVFLYGV